MVVGASSSILVVEILVVLLKSKIEKKEKIVVLECGGRCV